MNSVIRIEQLKRSHDEMLWALSDGSRTDMEAWDRADVFDFFRGLSIHQDRIKKLLKDTKQRSHAHN